MPKHPTAARIALATLLALGGPTFADEGDLDPTLYSNRHQPGHVAIDFPTLTMEIARVVLPLPDGGILVVGDGDGHPSDPIVPQIALAKLLPQSATYAYPGGPLPYLDGSFGAGTGLSTIKLGAADTSVEVQAAALQPDGRILVLGKASSYASGETTWSMLLARFLANGALDTSFGDGGVVLTPLCFAASCALFIPAAAHMVLLPDGAPLVVNADAYLIDIDGGNRTVRDVVLTLRRFSPGGDADAGFGFAGKVELDDAPGLGLDVGVGFARLARRPDGDIALAYNTREPGNFTAPPVVTLLSPDGAPRAAFGSGGSVRVGAGIDAGSILLPTAIDALADGRIVLGGIIADAATLTSDMFAARVTAVGAIDAGFGDGGIATTVIDASSQAVAIAHDADGRTYLGGFSSVVPQENTRATLLRFTPSGDPDTALTPDGFRRYPELALRDAQDDFLTQERINSIAFGPGNALVAAGSRAHPDMYDRSRDAMLVFRLQTVDVFGDGFE